MAEKLRTVGRKKNPASPQFHRTQEEIEKLPSISGAFLKLMEPSKTHCFTLTYIVKNLMNTLKTWLY